MFVFTPPLFVYSNLCQRHEATVSNAHTAEPELFITDLPRKKNPTEEFINGPGIR
jgi:hypothetical protein